jgi:hypothetical protein
MRSLRSYLERLDETLPDQLFRVEDEVDWQYEVTACVTEMEKSRDNQGTTQPCCSRTSRATPCPSSSTCSGTSTG